MGGGGGGGALDLVSKRECNKNQGWRASERSPSEVSARGRVKVTVVMSFS